MRKDESFILSIMIPDSDFASLEKGIKKCFIDTYKQIDEQFLVEARRTLVSIML